jgi:6-phosphofructokinase 1
VDLVVAGRTNRYVVWRDGQPTDVALEDVAGKTRGLKPDGVLVATARQLGICLGD